MTNEEAREILMSIEIESYRDVSRQWFFSDVNEALDLAIKALEQQPSEDCISREAVMKCFKKWQPYMATRLWDYEQELKDLPSVTPTISKMEQVEDCVARSEALDILDDFEEDVENGKFKTAYAKARERMCELPSVTPSYNSIKSDLKLCEDWKFYYKHGYTQAKRDLLCEDCISRETLLNSLKGFEILHNHDELRSNLIYGIMNLPSVTPKPKMGRWINSKCDKCGASRPPLFDNYCPNCGAKMEEVE